MQLSRRRRLWFILRTKGKAALFLFFCIFLAFTVAICAMITKHFRKMAVDLALATATDGITITVNYTITDMMRNDQLDYSNLVTLEKDTSGNITALVTNIESINLLQAEITNAIVERFGDSDITSVYIPMGNLIGGTLLSGRGPRIKVDILSVTNVSTSFRNEFSSAGINQTRHQIFLDVDVGLSILLADYSATDSVLTEVSIAETVIVGTVPGTYAKVS